MAQDLPNDEITSLTAEISRLMDEGRSAASKGEPVPVSRTEAADSALAADPNEVTAEHFLQAVYVGAVETRGWLRKSAEDGYDLFLREAAEESGLLPSLPFFQSVASAWVRFSAGRASEEANRRMARACARKLLRSWHLGLRAHLAKSILAVSLHRIDVPAQIRAAGWLDAEILRLRPSTRAHFLDKNRKTILAKSLKANDPHYPQKVFQALPLMIDALNALVSKMRTSPDDSVQEAANHLAGAPSKGRRGNIGSVVNHAIASGRLLDYVREVESRFADGAIVREIDSAIRRLGAKSGYSEHLLSNKSSIISRSIHHGIDNYKSKLEKALSRIDTKQKVRLRNLEMENRRLKHLVADLMLNRNSDES